MEKRYVAGVGDDKKNFKENSKAAWASMKQMTKRLEWYAK